MLGGRVLGSLLLEEFFPFLFSSLSTPSSNHRLENVPFVYVH